MLSAWDQIPRIRAERMLESLQVQSVESMKAHDRTRFVDRLIEQARGVVDEIGDAMESVIWNGKVLKTARALRGRVVEAFGRGAAA